MPRPSCSIDQLSQLDVAALKAQWSKTFGSSPPTGAKREFLIRLLAYGLQERIHNASARPILKALLSESLVPKSSTIAPALQSGSRLVRDWGGSTHEVSVVERGFAYRGQRYRSLSEIAKVITGAHWSGPRFFGLNATASTRRSHEPAA